jgi:nitrogen regulatory protein PII
MSNYEYEVIFCIVNAGYSEEVMDVARGLGCNGGTVIRARGTANPESEKLFNIPIHPEKEIVMMVIKSSIKNEILHSLYKAVGLNTPGSGIAFTMPVEDVVGLAPEIAVEIPAEDAPSAE